MRIRCVVTADRLPELISRLTPRLAAVVSKAGHDIEGNAKVAIQSGEKTGRMYGDHQASAPGEAPATDTGNLVNNIGFQMTGDLEGIVTSGAEYSAALELGSTKAAPRPFLMPAVDKVKGPFRKAIKKVIEQG